MFNKQIIVGNLTRDIELRYLPSGGAIAKGAIASTYKYKDQSGQAKEEVCFLDFTAFGRGGEVLNQFVKKGSKVMLEGRLIFEQWTAQDGTNRSKHSLRVDNFVFLDSKQDNNQQQGQNYGQQGQYNPQDNQYAQGQHNQQYNQQNNNYQQGHQ